MFNQAYLIQLLEIFRKHLRQIFISTYCIPNRHDIIKPGSCSKKLPQAGVIPLNGDDWLRRERLFPECEPRGAELVKPAQNIKCQTHFLCCYASRCISDMHNSRSPLMRSRPLVSNPVRDKTGRDKYGVPRITPLYARKI